MHIAALARYGVTVSIPECPVILILTGFLILDLLFKDRYDFEVVPIAPIFKS